MAKIDTDGAGVCRLAAGEGERLPAVLAGDAPEDIEGQELEHTND